MSLDLGAAETPADALSPDALCARARALPPEQRRAFLEEATSAALGRVGAGLPPPEGLPRLVSEACDALRGVGALPRGAALAGLGAALLGGSLHFTSGKAQCHAGELRGAEAALRRYLREAVDRPPRPDDDPEASPQAARHLLGRVALLDGQLRLAERWLKEGLLGASEETRVPMGCDLVRVWLRARRLDRALAGLSDLCDAPSEDQELLLLSAEVALMLGDPQGALPLCRAAVDHSARDDRAAALLATLLLKGAPGEPAAALALLPLLPGRRFDTLAVRLHLLALRGEGPSADGGEATRSAAQALLASLPPRGPRQVLRDEDRPS